jgi:Cytochrome c oxidase subunit IV
MEETGATHEEGAMHDHAAPTGSIQLPAPTAWPMVLALGISLMLAGLMTHWAISLLGLLMTVPAIVGWFFEVLPQEHHVYVDVHTDVVEIKSTRDTLAHLPIDERHRKLLPVETFSVMAGVKGGIAGGVAMVVPAALYSFIRYHSVWYAANLLAAGGFVSWAGESDEFLAQFHPLGLLAALGIHALTSVLIGLLYGAMLPMFPRWPILSAGFIAPFLWTGILRSALGIISPILDQRIDWWWFIASQIAFGLVAGFVVNLQVKVRTPQFRALPFVVRAGIHSLEGDKDNKAP